MRSCPLCGAQVDPNRTHCAGACPLARHCHVLCCESCGYEFVENSAVVSGLARLAGWIRRKNERAATDR